MKKKIIWGILSGVAVIAIACTIYVVAGSASREKAFGFVKIVSMTFTKCSSGYWFPIQLTVTELNQTIENLAT